ncbi:MAG: hypothetical protein ACREFF_14020, partial [Candidatus Udaeobacter sp.]
RGGLIARTFELGEGKSSTVILRRTPGASLFQSPIAALPVSSVSLSAAASNWTEMLKAAAMKIAQEEKRTAERCIIIFVIALRSEIAWIG